MTSKVLALGVGALAVFASTSAAMAQAAAPAAPALPPIAQGPAIPGVCIISPEEAVATSVVGKYVDQRLAQLETAVNGELTPEGQAIAKEDQAMRAAQATTDPAVLNQRQANLQLRATNFQRLRQQRAQELQATQQKAYGRVGQELQAALRGVYQTSHCSILLNGDAVVIGNPAMDITGAAVTALNARIQQFQFDREKLNPPAGGAAPGGQ
ncbi:OmpH family outer membrane protein [Caulobacter sp. KR2-114]|uniref:OmpH family outer membrane protein n=1 Tax=Caulobacter sp. KR2-114 TaxID=3400912 RepID=UPI003BFEC190